METEQEVKKNECELKKGQEHELEMEQEHELKNEQRHELRKEEEHEMNEEEEHELRKEEEHELIEEEEHELKEEEEHELKEEEEHELNKEEEHEFKEEEEHELKKEEENELKEEEEHELKEEEENELKEEEEHELKEEKENELKEEEEHELKEEEENELKGEEHEKKNAQEQMKNASRGKVMYDYDAENEDELTVKVGDVLEILKVEPDGQEGWVEARVGDKIGLVPDNFFEALPDIQPQLQVQLRTKSVSPSVKETLQLSSKKIVSPRPQFEIVGEVGVGVKVEVKAKVKLEDKMQSFDSTEEKEVGNLNQNSDVQVTTIESQPRSKSLKDFSEELEQREKSLKDLTEELEKCKQSLRIANCEIQKKQEAISMMAGFFEELEQCKKSLKMANDEIQRKQDCISLKDRELNDLKILQGELSTKLNKYGKLFDESWLEGSWASWSVKRSEVDKISQQHLGVGAWGIVYSGNFKGQKVAIKHAHKELLQIHGIGDMIKREINIMAHIKHPNLVRFIGAVFDREVEAGRDVPIILLELMDMNLRTGYTSETFSRSTMISIFSDVAYALHYLHEQITPIIHRDISAPNVLLKRLGHQMFRAKVSDFGSANLASQSKTAAPGAIIYTPPEMFPQEDMSVAPPEQTVKVDVYSYGVLLLEVVCRELPVVEKRHLMLQQCKSNWERLYAIIIQCAKKNPEERLSMREILKCIELINP